MEDDRSIIRAVLGGDRDQFRLIVTRYQSRVFAVAMKMSGNRHDAEEITQEVFIQTFRSLHRFQEQSRFSTWLYRIAVNTGIDWKRKADRRFSASPTEQAPIQDEANNALDTRLIRQENTDRIRQLLASLKPKYRDVVQLYYFEELSQKQIAERLHIATKTVDSRLYRARKMLRKKWQGGVGNGETCE